MTIYTTPSPPGSPDFTTPTLRAGQQLSNASGSTSSTVTLGPFYCGNVSAISLYAGFSASALRGFTLTVGWYADSGAVHQLWQLDDYQGLCQATCAVVDCLPVLGPYVVITITATGGSISYITSIVTALATQHRVLSLPNYGLPMGINATVAHSAAANYYPSFITPGLYAYSMAVNATVTSVQISLNLYNAASAQQAIVAYVNNPVAGTLYQGLIVLGSFMPSYLVTNANATTSVQVFLSLTGPQM